MAVKEKANERSEDNVVYKQFDGKKDAKNNDDESVMKRKRIDIEESLRSATARLAKNKHVSTKYPPVWMPPATLHEQFPVIFSNILVTIIFGLFIGCSTYAMKNEVPMAAIGLLITLFPLSLISVAIWICSKFPLEYVENLNFRAVQVINIGSIITLLFGHSNFISQGVNENLGSFFGTTILSLGTAMFTYCTFILGPWEFMVGSPLLTIGLILRNCSAYAVLYHDRNVFNIVKNLNVSACPFLFIALGFVLKKAYQLMRLPLLGSDNFRFIGVVFYGGSIVANAVVSVFQSVMNDGDSGSGPYEAYDFVFSITSSFAFFGTCFFLLDSSRVKNHSNAILEDRYPSTMYLARHLEAFQTANISTSLLFILSFISTVIFLYEDVQDQHNEVTGVNQLINSVITTLCVAMICTCVFYPSLQIALESKEKKVIKFISLNIIGFTIFLIGNLCNGVFAFLSGFEINASVEVPSSIDLSLRISQVITSLGTFIMIFANWPMNEAVSKVFLFHPSSWENIYHPSNYILLSSIWLFIGSLVQIKLFYALSSLAYTWAYAVMLLHFNMAFYVWESMNLESEHNFFGDSSIDELSEKEYGNFISGEPNDFADVFICGGGISGLFLACILGKLGIKVYLCERRKKPITDARFAVLNSASMEYLEDILDDDIFEELTSRALPDSTHFGSMLLSGLGHPNAKVIAAANSPPRRTLMQNLHQIDDWTESRTLGSRHSSHLPLRIMQSHQEEVLRLQLSRYEHVKCCYGWVLKDLHINIETGVAAKVSESNESKNEKLSNLICDADEKIVHAKYIVGCDGPSSLVAETLKVNFDGLLNLAETKSLLVHAPGLYSKVINSLGNTHQHQIIRKNFGLGALVSTDPSRDLWNFLFLFGEKALKASPEEISKQFLGVDNFEIVQNRSWYWNFFVARNFRVGKKAFLVGDSAHSWPPFGGLGGNTGYGDAINLGWKLALACKGKASELLLDSYGIERRQHVLQTAMYVMRATPNPAIMQVITSRLFYNRIYRPVISAAWYHHNSGTHGANHFAQSGIQFGIKLNYSPVINHEDIILPDDPSCKYNPSFRAGCRMPFLPFSKDESNFDHLDEESYTILVTNTNYIDASNDLAAAIKARNVPAKVSVIPHIEVDSFQGCYKEIAKQLSEESILVVRPDHVIAWRRDPSTLYQPRFADIAASITGFGDGAFCLKKEYNMSDDAKTTRCYHAWLTREFKYSLRPYKFRFPNAIAIDNLTKASSISIVKERKRAFTTTTKQGDEKYEEKKSFDYDEEKPKLSGFETMLGPRSNPIYRLNKLAMECAARNEPVFNFAVGNPSLEPPKEVLESIIKLGKDALEGRARGLFKYAHPSGITSLRNHVAKEIGEWQGICDINANNIIVTPGAQSAIVNVFEALVQKGDHILIQTPYYPAYEQAASLWGAQTVNIDFSEHNFDIDLQSLRNLCANAGKKLRIIVLCSPSNPTGNVITSETLLEVSKIARDHSNRYDRDVWVLMDHTYWRLTFNSNVPAILPLYKESIIISSFSKDISLAGERIGYVVVNPSSRHASNLSSWISCSNDRLGNISTPSMIQHVLADVYEKYGKLPTMRGEYEIRVNFMHEKLCSFGLKCNKPEGAFYLFPKLPEGIDDNDFAEKLAGKGVLVVPGSEFGSPGYIRLAALPSVDEIFKGCDLIEQMLKELNMTQS